MNKTRPNAVAGKFYPGKKEELSQQLESFERNQRKDYNYSSRAIIVPHAGYYYSGQLASRGFQYLKKDAKNVFIIAPAHYVAVKNVALSSFAKWETPLGETEVNQLVNEELVKKFGCEYEDSAFAQEHSAEVQVPFVQQLLPHAKIIPILTGHNCKKIIDIINHYWQDPQNVFVISSDLSHFHHSNEAKRLDAITAEMIETGIIENFDPHQACGATGVCSLVDFRGKYNYSLIRVGLINSGDITGDVSSVVGYGSWFLYEGAKNDFIKKYFSKTVIDVCKKSISSMWDKKEVDLDALAPVFNQLGACFVTLEKNGDLRGCIGSIIAHRPLIDDLIKNAQNSAFSDPRFKPLEKDEFQELSIDVSLLSDPEKMAFKDEKDLLEQIRPFVDGIIIKDGGYQSVYLPSVWEQLPDKETFLKSLKIKAGLAPQHFSNTFEAFRFTTEYIKG